MTAVEWLENELDLDLDSKWIINKALEMEKEQKHAEYMRGWKDRYVNSNKIFKNTKE